MLIVSPIWLKAKTLFERRRKIDGSHPFFYGMTIEKIDGKAQKFSGIVSYGELFANFA